MGAARSASAHIYRLHKAPDAQQGASFRPSTCSVSPVGIGACSFPVLHGVGMLHCGALHLGILSTKAWHGGPCSSVGMLLLLHTSGCKAFQSLTKVQQGHSNYICFSSAKTVQAGSAEIGPKPRAQGWRALIDASARTGATFYLKSQPPAAHPLAIHGAHTLLSVCASFLAHPQSE